MRAGQKDRWEALQLFVLLSLLILSTEFEVRGQEDDCAALHRLRGASGWERPDGTKNPAEPRYQKKNPAEPSLMTAQLFLQQEELFFWGRVEGRTRDTCPPADPVPQFDHQQILLLQDDPVVRSAAAHLYDQHPSVSSVHVLDQNQRATVLKGPPVPLSENSSLVLVGHGARDASGQMRVSGFTCGDVARIIQSCSRTGPRIRTTTVVACEVGSDERFAEDLLKKLREAGVQTELHLWKTVVQVTESGKIISQEASPDGPEWRHEDCSKKLVLTVGSNGELRRTSRSGCRGQSFFTNSTNFLQPTGKSAAPENKNSWPETPEKFIDPEIYNLVHEELLKQRLVDQNLKLDEVRKALELLQSFSWGLFHLKSDEEPQTNQNDQTKLPRLDVNRPGNFVLRDKTGSAFNWIDQANIKTHLQNCYVIRSGRDIRNIIRHFAKDGENGNAYLMINSWIFLIEPLSLYVFPAGKQLEGDDTEAEIKTFIDLQERGSESYTNLRSKVIKDDPKNYPYFVKNLFLRNPAQIKPSNTKENPFKIEMFYIWYFTASCIAESTRNVRTFPLTLMALFMYEKHAADKEFFWFNQHPMATGGTWIHADLRGFEGAAAPDVNKLSEAAKNKLVEVLMKEYLVVEKWQKVLFELYPNCRKIKAMVQLVTHYLPLEGEENEKELKEKEQEDFMGKCNNFLQTINNVKPDGATASASDECPDVH